MDSVTETCVVPVPKERIFAFLSDIENMPEWSTEFVKDLAVVNGKYKAKTPCGDLFLRIESDPRSGIIDIYAGATEGEMTPAYLRVLAFPGGSSGVTFTFFKWPGTDDAVWRKFCGSIKVEVGNIKRLFS